MVAAGATIFVLAALTLGAVWDIRSLTLPNWLCAALAAAFFPVALAAGADAGDIGLHMLTAVAVLAAGFGLFSAGVFGGGDAKLLAALGLWFGWPAILPLSIAIALAGGLLALMITGLRAAPLPAGLQGRGWLARLHQRKSGIPYGAAIAAGTYYYILTQNLIFPIFAH